LLKLLNPVLCMHCSVVCNAEGQSYCSVVGITLQQIHGLQCGLH